MVCPAFTIRGSAYLSMFQTQLLTHLDTYWEQTVVRIKGLYLNLDNKGNGIDAMFMPFYQ